MPLSDEEITAIADQVVEKLSKAPKKEKEKALVPTADLSEQVLAVLQDKTKCQKVLDALTACQEDVPLTRKDLKYLGALIQQHGGLSGVLAQQYPWGGSSGRLPQRVDINAAFDAYRSLVCNWLLATLFPLSFCNRALGN